MPLKQYDRKSRSGEYPYYGASGVIDFIDDYIFDGEYILIGEDGANLLARTTAIAFKANGKFWVNNHAHILKNKKALNDKYLIYFFNTLDLKPFVTGSAQPKLTKKNLSSIPIPLPPLETQKRIVELLDRAQALIDKRKEQIKLMDDLIQSLFYDMFGDPVTNPMGWEKEAFGKTIHKIVGGKSVGGEERTLGKNEFAVLKISAVTSGVFNPEEYKVVSEKDIPELMIHPNEGDLLFSRANTRELVGATCIVDGDYKRIFLPDKLWKIKLDISRIEGIYVKTLLTHEGFRNNLKKLATGTSGSMLNISKAKLMKLVIPIPPITLQNTFAKRVEKIETQKQAMTNSLKELEDNFNVLMQRAFKGELDRS